MKNQDNNIIYNNKILDYYLITKIGLNYNTIHGSTSTIKYKSFIDKIKSFIGINSYSRKIIKKEPNLNYTEAHNYLILYNAEKEIEIEEKEKQIRKQKRKN